MRVKQKSLHVLILTTASLILGIALWPAGLPPAAPSKTEIASQRPGEPPLKKMPEGAARPAALFPRLGQRSNALAERAPGGAAGDQKAIFDWVKQATTAFWNAYLKNDPDARSWLVSDSVERISREAAKLERR